MSVNGNRNDTLDRAVEAVRLDAPDPDMIEAAAHRVWERVAAEAAPAPALADGAVEPDRIRGCADVQALIPAWLEERLPEARARLVADHTRNCVPCRRALLEARALRAAAGQAPAGQVGAGRLRAAAWMRAAAAVVLVGGISAAAWLTWQIVSPPVLEASGRIQQVDGELYRVENASLTPVPAGTSLGRGEVVRTGRDGGAVVRMADGSRIEMRARSEIALQRKGDGAVIELARGSVVVEASKQGAGHLYVQTPDCLVAVTGTIFSVDHGTLGSRVGVLEGEVHVSHGRSTDVLEPGEQVATRPGMAPVPLAEQIAWSRNVARYADMLDSLRALGREIDARVPMPAMRTSARLLDLAPEGTVIYAALPNLSSQIGEASRILQERLQGNQALAGWWERAPGAPEIKAEVDRVIERIETLGRDLGDEIVVTVQAGPGGNPEGFTVLAELRNAEAFRTGLQSEFERAAAKSDGPRQWRFLAADERAPQSDGNTLLLWAHDGLFAASTSGPRLAEVLAGSPKAGSAFRERIAGAYADGTDWLFAVDIARLVRQSTDTPTGERHAMEQLGITDTQHLLVEHQRRGDRTLDTALLTFDRPRRGLASWLAEPAPMGGLDFVSPDATMAAAFVVKEPATLMDDVLAMMTGTDQSLAEGAERFQREHGIDLRKDLAEPLGGEFVFALDGPMLPKPAWKLVVEVYDAGRLQSALEKLVAEADVAAQEENRGHVTLKSESARGRTYHVIQTPMLDLHYTFDDGYLLAAPMRVLLDQAIERRAAGLGLPSSSKFASMLPDGTGTHVSALGWENLGPAFQAARKAASATGQGGNAGLEHLAQEWPGTLVYAVAAPDRITFSSGGKTGLEDDLTRLFGIPGLLQGQAAIAGEIGSNMDSEEPGAAPAR
ncbi:MAG TPA: FecR domain-containing protein [Candidatus Polarisedimenticolaceae bacterium]|nr:FecR domain-containing protein [Candidatus Polarisedimenticolaceae bacterium]